MDVPTVVANALTLNTDNFVKPALQGLSGVLMALLKLVLLGPLYGAYARDTHTVPAPQPETWLRDLNLTIRYRMAAGGG